MAERGRQMLQEIYAASPGKIDLIAHGIPDVGFVDPAFFKDQFGVEGKIVLLTFGLLSPTRALSMCSKPCPRFWKNFPMSSTSSSAPLTPTNCGNTARPTG